MSHFNIAAFALQNATGPLAEKDALRIVRADGTVEKASHRELALASLRIGGGLRARGIRVGDRVLVRMQTSMDYATAVLAAWACGAIVVPSSEALTRDEAGFLADDAEVACILYDQSLPAAASQAPRIRFCDMDQATPLADFAPTAEDDPALLIYTSGTTRRPKGVLHAHRMALGRAPMRDGWTDLQRDDILVHAGKLNWTYTLGLVLIDALSTGATAVVYAGPPAPDVWPQLIATHRGTIFAAVPSIYRRVLKYNANVAEALSTLRHGLTAGEPLRPALADAWQQTVGVPLYEALGMSECSTYVSSGPATPPRPGTPGKPQPGRRVAVLPMDGNTTPLAPGNTGLLAVHRSDPGLMLGYWRRPAEQAEAFRDEWFIGGDLARIDDDGYVYFEGRRDDLMNAMGYRVSPLEVEAELGEIDGVTTYAIAERMVRDEVSVVCLYAVLAPGKQPDAAERARILADCSHRVATYKRPREVVFCDALPVGRNGKLQRRALAQLSSTRYDS